MKKKNKRKPYPSMTSCIYIYVYCAESIYIYMLLFLHILCNMPNFNIIYIVCAYISNRAHCANRDDDSGATANALVGLKSRSYVIRYLTASRVCIEYRCSCIMSIGPRLGRQKLFRVYILYT